MPDELLRANLVQALLECLLYGIYFVIFTLTVHLFVGRHGFPPKTRPARLVLAGLTLQFVVITGHWVITLYRTIYAIGTLGGAVAFYSDMTQPAFIANIVFMVTSHTITDAFVLQRLYVLSSRDRQIILFPAACLVVQIVSAAGIVVRAVLAERGEDYLSLSNSWLACKLVTSIIISIYSTITIFAQLMWMVRAFPMQTRNAQLRSLLAIIVESAALQLALTILILVAFQAQWVAGIFISTGIAGVTFGICTVLLHMRIGLGWAKDDETVVGSYAASTMKLSTRSASVRKFAIDEESQANQIFTNGTKFGVCAYG
ncbi:hypothetical protein MIND_01065800 [Mycena indigotica]|uniref:Uncharacterized protein n=1 Tax=Mycena indigotica TaxID=2126181 RepID=A0A8H6SAA4_9AGAR|nr:uncharacterized protein MIND_01065800 [Mycena indigotica]KAF7295267.1 hypothetical protein MIND_01065800 [Mycena indigotica]